MGWRAWVQSQVASYQRLLKWYLIPPCITFRIIRYVSGVKWSYPGKGVAPSSTPRCCSYWKGGLLVALDYGRQLIMNTFPLSKSFRNQKAIGTSVTVAFEWKTISTFLSGLILLGTSEWDLFMTIIQSMVLTWIWTRLACFGVCLFVLLFCFEMKLQFLFMVSTD